MPIKIYPNKNLLRPCSNSITENNIEKAVNHLIEMKNIVEERDALGIASNQLGGNYKAIVAKLNGMYTIMLNPRIIESEGDVLDQEGCLSFPGVLANINRYFKIKVEWEDMSLKTRVNELTHLESVIVQHEVDHLLGVSIYQRAGKATKLMILKDLKKGIRRYNKILELEQKQKIMKDKIEEMDRKNKILTDAELKFE